MLAPNRIASLWDMLSNDAAAFIKTLAHINRLAGLCQNTSADAGALGKGASSGIKSHTASLAKALAHWDVPATLASTREMAELCDKPSTTYRDLGDPLMQISARLHAEIDGRKLYVLDKGEAAYLKHALFGTAVEDAFPSAVEDIAEAGKCVAFSRYTAAVFHLMRAMECAVQRLSEALAISDVEREWGKLLSDMEGKIKVMKKGDDKDNWSESHSHLYHVKQAWRNKTMHPKKTYTEDEAEAVFTAVRSFMRHLAPLIT